MKSSHVFDMKKAFVDFNGVWEGKWEENGASGANDCRAVTFPVY